MNKKILVLLPAMALMLGACAGRDSSNSKSNESGSGQVEKVESVEVNLTTATLDVGESVELRAVAKPASLSNKEVTWSTSDPQIASVAPSSAGCIVSGVGEGKATITAASVADPTVTATCEITVNKAKVLVVEEAPSLERVYRLGVYQGNLDEYIYLNGQDESAGHLPTSSTFSGGAEVKLEAGTGGKYFIKIGENYLNTPTDYHIRIESTKTTEWTWNEEYQTFTVVPPKTSDTYFIGTYNTYETLSACNINLIASDFIGHLYYQADPVPATSITISGPDSVYAGGTAQFRAKLGPVGGVGEVTFSVTDASDAAVEGASIDNKGLLTVADTVAAGTNLKVTAHCGELKDSMEITVKQEINYGSETAPLTIAQAKEVLDITGSAYTEQHVYVKGYVYSNTATGLKSAGSTRGTIWLTDDEGSVAQAFELFATYVDDVDHSLTEQAAGALVGKQIIAHGFGQVYSGTTYELTSVQISGAYDNPLIVAIDDTNPRTPTAIELSSTEPFELEQGASRPVSATFKPYAATGTVEFTVSPAGQGVSYEGGKVVASDTATVGDYTLTATCGTLTASCAFSVKAAGIKYTSIGALSFNKNAGVTITNELTDGTDPKITYAENGVTIVVRKNTSSNDVNVWQSSYSSCRWYVGHKVDISSATAFRRVVLTCDSSYDVFKDSKTGVIAGVTGGASVSYDSASHLIILDLDEAVTSLTIVPDKQIRPSNVELFKVGE